MAQLNLIGIIFKNAGGDLALAKATLKATVVALNENRDIFMVLDHRNHSLGTGTREVCEFLAELISRAAPPPVSEGQMLSSDSKIRSAIRI